MSTYEVIQEVYAERREQVQREGYTYDHDDGHPGQMALAASCYAAVAGEAAQFGKTDTAGQRPPSESWWPWEPNAWKPKNSRRDLVRAAALIIAEIERLDRTAKRAQIAAVSR